MKTLLLAFIFLPLILHAQAGFNNIYTLDAPSSSMHGVTNNNGAIITIATAYNPASFEWDLHILKLDTLGNIEDTYERSNEFGYNMVNSEIISTTDNGFLIIGDMDTSRKGVVLKINQNLELAFHHVIEDSINRSFFHREAIEVSDGYIIGGKKQMHSWDHQAWAMKLDYEGNQLWYQEYGAVDTSEFVYDMALTIDGNVILTGNKNNIQEVTSEEDYFWARPWSLFIDAGTGAKIRERMYVETVPEGHAFAIHPMPDGSYLTGGSKRVEATPSFGFRLALRRLDNNGDLIWENTYGPSIQGDVQYMYKILSQTEDRYIAVGHGMMQRPGDPQVEVKVAITIAFNPEDGSEYWVRTDTIPIDTIDNKGNYVQGATILPSGSIVVAGYNNTGRAYGWLFKMDADGCIAVDDCPLITATKPEPIPVQANPRVYPNPASEVVYFDQLGDAQLLQITAINGRVILQQALHHSSYQWQLTNIPEGIYFYSLWSEQEQVKTGKIVVDK